MLKKKLSLEAIEKDWFRTENSVPICFKVPSTLIIPEDCIGIGYRAFSGCVRLEKVVIPESVKEIGMRAFNGCKNLKEVIIPKSVEKIRYCAFYKCVNATIILKKPESKFEYIEDYAFNGCNDVKEEVGN